MTGCVTYITQSHVISVSNYWYADGFYLCINTDCRYEYCLLLNWFKQHKSETHRHFHSMSVSFVCQF